MQVEERYKTEEEPINEIHYVAEYQNYPKQEEEEEIYEQ